jgi:hypothetical protein
MLRAEFREEGARKSEATLSRRWVEFEGLAGVSK